MNIIVTGGNSGIGFNLTKELVQVGHRVAVFDLSGSSLAPLAAMHPDRLIFQPCDLTSDADVRAAVDAVLAAWGGIDVLVNNACLATFSPFVDRTLAETRAEFEVNYFGYLRTIAAVRPAMAAQGRGVIHNFSSGVGITGFPGIIGYASTKGAIESMTRTLALELAPSGITVNLIHPPLTNTKSSAPLGVPKRFMADPAAVGRKLARRIGSKKPVITPDFSSAVGILGMRLFPNAFGRLLAGATARAREGKQL